MSDRSRQAQSQMSMFGLSGAVIMGTPTFRTVHAGAKYETYDARNTVTNINSGNVEENHIEGSLNTYTVTRTGQAGRPRQSQTPGSDPYANGPVTTTNIASFNMTGNDVDNVLERKKKVIFGPGGSRVEIDAKEEDVQTMPEGIVRAHLGSLFGALGLQGVLPPTSSAGGAQPPFTSGPVFEDVMSGAVRQEHLQGTAVTNFGSFNVRNNTILDSMNHTEREYRS